MIDMYHDVIQVENKAQDPENHFKFSVEDLEGALATWHTHHSGSANLSIADYWFFQSWTSLGHFIIFKQDVRFFQPHEGQVYLVEEETDHPSWLPEGTV